MANYGICLGKDPSDQYNVSFFKNTYVFQGYFFEADNLIDNTYKLNSKKKAMVYLETNRYICSNMNSIKKGRRTLF